MTSTKQRTTLQINCKICSGMEEEGGAGHQEGDDPHAQKSDRSPNLLHAVLSRVHYHLRQANNK